jgi:hypothetical protein
LQSGCLEFATESLLGLAFYLGLCVPQSQGHICAMFEEALVAQAEGIWAKLRSFDCLGIRQWT